VDLGAAVVADEQALEAVQPGEGALDHPAVASEPGAVLGLAAGDLGGDPALAELAAVLVVVVAAVGGYSLGSPARAAELAGHGRDPLDKRDQLGDVVAVAARACPGERESAGIDQEVVLGAGSSAINRARARLGAPFFACT
jgi:hypothetical protein